MAVQDEVGLGVALHGLFREVFALQAALAKEMDRVHEQAGLTTAQLKIARILEQTGGATVPDMAARLGVSRQSVQTVCNTLKDRGDLEFNDNPRHKRSKLAALTRQGREAFHEAQRQEAAIIEQHFAGIEHGRIKDAGELLAHLRSRLESGPPETAATT